MSRKERFLLTHCSLGNRMFLPQQEDFKHVWKKAQRPSSAPLTGRWKTDDLWLSAVGGRQISPNPSGHVLQPASDQRGLTLSLVSTEKSTAWFLINPFFRGIFLRFISFLFAELISEMYVALNTKDGHNIRVRFHDQLPTSVLITSTTTSTCDAGIKECTIQIVINKMAPLFVCQIYKSWRPNSKCHYI